MSFSASSDEGGGSDYGSIYLGTTCAEGDTDTSPPSISWVDYTTYGNEERGTSGYVILYGSNFTSPYAATTTSLDHGSATYVSEDQINLYYSIPVNTNSGGNSTGISVTLAGVDPTAYATSYVYDCPLYISSASVPSRRVERPELVFALRELLWNESERDGFVRWRLLHADRQWVGQRV